MAINMLIVREDLTTIIKQFYGIIIDDDFFHLRQVALAENCILVATIDDAGDTVINQLQLKFFKNEIVRLRIRKDLNQKILDQLQEISDAIDPARCQYIKFVGD